MSENKENLPEKKVQLIDLHFDKALAAKNDQLKTLLNKRPPTKWLKKHPMATKKVTVKDDKGKDVTKTVAAEYLPIDKVELLLDKIFQFWKHEIVRESAMFHSVVVTVRIHYRHPVTGEWFFHDGIGACKVQSDSGAPFNENTIKASGVQMAAPAAAAYALKDAADHLGKLFGRDVNRADTLEFQGDYDKKEEPTPEEKQEQVKDERLLELIKAAKTVSGLEKLKINIRTVEHSKAYDAKLKELKSV